MKKLIPPAVALMAVAMISSDAASATNAVEVTRLSDRVIVLRLSPDPSEFNNIVALKTAKGIVVVDTHLSPYTASLIRSRALEEFRADSVAYVVNTHAHGDHTFGNQAFPEAVIIGHENVPAEMQASGARLPATIQYLKRRADQLKNRWESSNKGSEEAQSLKKEIDGYEGTVRSLENGFQLTPPALTFSDKMVLDLGDIHLELTYFGTSHSHSDILIYCPEEKLLLTGDLFSPEDHLWVDSERIPFLPRWKECLELYTSDKTSVAHIIPGHRDFLDMDLLIGNAAFVDEKEKEFAGKSSTLFAVRDVHQREGMDAAVGALRGMAGKPESFYTLHPELDTYAYRLMMGDHLAEAQILMEALAELFPQNDVAFDSLGELCLRMNDKIRAAKNFQKALELNPDNQNAAAQLEKLKKKL